MSFVLLCFGDSGFGFSCDMAVRALWPFPSSSIGCSEHIRESALGPPLGDCLPLALMRTAGKTAQECVPGILGTRPFELLGCVVGCVPLWSCVFCGRDSAIRPRVWVVARACLRFAALIMGCSASSWVCCDIRVPCTIFCANSVRLCRLCADFAIPKGCMLNVLDWLTVGGIHIEGAGGGMDRNHTSVLLSRNLD